MISDNARITKRSVSTMVEAILKDLPKARDSDRYLQLVVWHKLGLVLTPDQRAKFMDMPSSETIRRVRQKVQEGGKYRATESVRKERYLKSLIMQQNAPSASVKRTEQLIQGGL